ncbi:hypothetical protein [Ectopseudomonas oleovorans]|uniref:hypothetical protein n=1 Tax=Ectopseudomonas oleovorans TaxID=301 RepID=UPI0018D54C97|nr:hypothetical protein [Pseudomonas oleovorans]
MAGLKQLNWASEGVGSKAAALVDLSTVAGNKISNPSWVKFQSAGWVNFPSAPTVQDIEPKDCELIDTLMTKYSCFEHSQSSEIPVFIPEEPELRQDLEALKAWRDGLNKRRAEAA